MSIPLPSLPFTIDALQPHISAATVDLHHGKHEAGYVERVNRLIAESSLADRSLTEIVRSARDSLDKALYNAAAQAWNHEFYWNSLNPRGGARPHGAIAKLVKQNFGNYETFATRLQQAAVGHFGSGWVWVVLDNDRLKIVTTSNADLPPSYQAPLLTIDVWEHAYYLDYQHRRAKHVEAVIAHLLNWEQANQRLEDLDQSALGRPAADELGMSLGAL